MNGEIFMFKLNKKYTLLCSLLLLNYSNSLFSYIAILNIIATPAAKLTCAKRTVKMKGQRVRFHITLISMNHWLKNGGDSTKIENAIDEALSKFNCKSLHIETTGNNIYFGGKCNRCIVQKVIKAKGLRRLQHLLYNALSKAGVQMNKYSPPETFIPHITLVQHIRKRKWPGNGSLYSKTKPICFTVDKIYFSCKGQTKIFTLDQDNPSYGTYYKEPEDKSRKSRKKKKKKTSKKKPSKRKKPKIEKPYAITKRMQQKLNKNSKFRKPCRKAKIYRG